MRNNNYTIKIDGIVWDVDFSPKAKFLGARNYINEIYLSLKNISISKEIINISAVTIDFSVEIDAKSETIIVLGIWNHGWFRENEIDFSIIKMANNL